MGARARIFGMIGLSAGVMLSVSLLLFACVHWHNAMPLIVVVPCVLAFYVPAICFGYQHIDSVQTAMDRETFETCRELSWAISGMLVLVAFAIPIIAWHWTGFAMAGVLVVDAALTCILCAFVLGYFFLVKRE